LADLVLTAPPGSFAARLILAAPDVWRAYTHHAFVAGLAAGTLPLPAFRHYLTQDYRFLVHFARAWALVAVKCEDVQDIREAAATVHALIDEELKLHVGYCRRFGIDEAVMAGTEEAPANLAYTRFVLERGLSGDVLDLLVALLPCVLGYAEIGARLIADPHHVRADNAYADWLRTYGGPEYQQTSAAVVAMVERIAAARLGTTPTASPRWPGLVQCFAQATRLEVDFWQMGLDAR